jgi:dTMP kinase
MAGLFVVFEGITGSGKKTYIRLIADRLVAAGNAVTIISFPNYETEIARLTKKRDYDNYTISLLHAADRTQYQERIKALLDIGHIVLCDRYSYSNFAYQSVQGLPMDWLQAIEKFVVKPDLIFLIDVAVDVSMRRLEQSRIEDFTKRELLERLRREREKLENIRSTYISLARTNKDGEWHIIDGNLGMEKNCEQMWEIIATKLSSTKS